jgi:hypothetical protein
MLVFFLFIIILNTYIFEAAMGAMVLQWMLSLIPSLAKEALKLARASLAIEGKKKRVNLHSLLPHISRFFLPAL